GAEQAEQIVPDGERNIAERLDSVGVGLRQTGDSEGHCVLRIRPDFGGGSEWAMLSQDSLPSAHRAALRSTCRNQGRSITGACQNAAFSPLGLRMVTWQS